MEVSGEAVGGGGKRVALAPSTNYERRLLEDAFHRCALITARLHGGPFVQVGTRCPACLNTFFSWDTAGDCASEV